MTAPVLGALQVWNHNRQQGWSIYCAHCKYPHSWGVACGPAESTSLGCLSETQDLRAHPRSTESEPEFQSDSQVLQMYTGFLLISMLESQGHTSLARRSALNRWRAPVSGKKGTHPWKELRIIVPGVIRQLDQEVGGEDLSRLFSEDLWSSPRDSEITEGELKGRWSHVVLCWEWKVIAV